MAGRRFGRRLDDPAADTPYACRSFACREFIAPVTGGLEYALEPADDDTESPTGRPRKVDIDKSGPPRARWPPTELLENYRARVE